jgi:hypothetical protein
VLGARAGLRPWEAGRAALAGWRDRPERRRGAVVRADELREDCP